MPERQLLVDWLGEAVAAGARKIRACREIGLSLRTLQRWTETGVIKADARTTVTRPTPRNALTEAERQVIATLCNSPEYAHLPPSQIVSRLADQGRYLASEATFYRVLQVTGQQQYRGRSQRSGRYAAPTTHAAKTPNQVGSWDITYPPSPIRGKYYYLYLIDDIYSRKAVGWEVYDVESGRESRRTAATQRDRRAVFTRTAGAALVQPDTDEISDAVEQDVRTGYHAFAGKTTCQQRQSLLGVAVQGTELLPAMAAGWFCQSGHRTRLGEGFHALVQQRAPAERHQGLDHQVLARRHELYERAKEKKPERWSGRTRNWEPIGTVMLNPDRE